MLLAVVASTAFAADDDVITIDNTAYLSFDGGLVSSDVVRVVRLSATVATIDFQPLPGAENLRVEENVAGVVLGVVRVEGLPGSVEFAASDPRFEFAVDDVPSAASRILRVKSGVSFDHETEPEVTVEIRASVGADAVSRSLTFTVLDVNEAPHSLTLSGFFVKPGVAGERIGQVSVLDPDTGDSHEIVVEGDSRFQVVDGFLALLPDASLPENTDVELRIVATDSGGLSTELLATVTSNPVNLPAPASPSSVRLLAPDRKGEVVEIVPAACEPPPGTVDSGSGASSRSLVSFAAVDSSGTVTIDNADAYAIGDPVYVSVFDADQNYSPLARDTVTVTLRVSGSDDSEDVLLTESDVDTGLFLGYIFTTSQASVANDCILTVRSRSKVDAVYRDPTDAVDVTSLLADISPVGIVFDDTTGLPLSGVVLTIIDMVTGLPAVVRGDGPEYALFPPSIVTGEDIEDQYGNVYEHGPGEYRFPKLPDGDYRLDIFNKSGLQISEKSDEELQALGASGGPTSLVIDSGGPFALGEASRGVPFTISEGALPRIDVPVAKIAPVVTAPTGSTIDFLQYGPNSAAGLTVDVQQTWCVAGQSREIAELNNERVPVPGRVTLAPATVIKAGQPVFIRVIDADQNRDPLVREKIYVELDVNASGDREFLELAESEPGSGEFFGYVQSTEGDPNTGNCVLGAVRNHRIRVTYTDAFDASDTSSAEILVDPFGLVFNTSDGAPIDGVTVTLIDMQTGQPATVRGDPPALADYPASVVSGGQVTDAAGQSYDFEAGQFRFPFVQPGTYRLALSNIPEGYLFPTTLADAVIQALPGGPFQLTTGSRGETFTVPVGPALRVDLPLDARDRELFLSKTASKGTAGVGEFVQYRVRIENQSPLGTGEITVTDVLPVGFRYQAGSLKFNETKMPDPAPDGRNLLLRLADLAGGAAAEIRYVAEITPGAPIGEATNTVTATGARIAEANVARSTVFVTEDLMSSKAILMGRVHYGECDAERTRGMGKIRIFLEDGTNVLTDSDGNWHIEGVAPGTHVVQLDLASLDSRYELADCEANNNRFAGRRFSRFVDVRGGTLWRADFYVKDAALPGTDVVVKQRVRRRDGRLLAEIDVDRPGSAALQELNLFYRPPKGWLLVPGTEKVDGEAQSPVKTMVGLSWPLRDVEHQSVTFELAPRNVEVPARALEQTVLRPRFATRSADLSGDSLAELDALVARMQARSVRSVKVVGHSDNVPIAPANRQEYADNYQLSRSRAAAVAKYLAGGLGLADDAFTVVGRGPDDPVADNRTREGRASNRRVEVLVEFDGGTPPVPPVGIGTDQPVVSMARALFVSANTPKGATEQSKVDLRPLFAGEPMVEGTVRGTALGSWEQSDDGPQTTHPDADKSVGILSHKDGDVLSQGITSIRVRLDSSMLPNLFLDGKEIPRERIGITIQEPESGTTLYSYIGVDLGNDAGERQLKLTGVDGFGVQKFEDDISVTRAGQITDMRFVKSAENVADGLSPVIAYVELLDDRRRVVKTNQELTIKQGDLEPWSGENERRSFDVKRTVSVTGNGMIRFNPVDKAGAYRMVLGFNDVERAFDITVKPESREWILVGLGEGTIGYANVTGNMSSLKSLGLEQDYYSNGRLAFYAKGQVRGEWLLTLSYDTAKVRDNSIFRKINPGTYYTLYGDASTQIYDAPGQEKLYVRVEKDSFNTTLGDFATNLTMTELGRYSRNLSGVYVEQNSDRYRANLFAAQTTQAYVRDEIRGDGTSGIYRLSRTGILRNSEKIRFETRDRFRNELVLDVVQQARGLDYNIDYERGEVIFKAPVFSQDARFNPVFIVAEYESDAGDDERITSGGRVGVFFADKRGEVGVTAVREGTPGREANLHGADVAWEFGESTRLEAEIAETNAETGTGPRSGRGYRVELEQASEKWESEVHVRRQDTGFGLGQQSNANSGVEEFGGTVRYKLTEVVNVTAEAYRESDLETARNRRVVQASTGFNTEKTTFTIGGRSALDSGGGEPEAESQQLTASASTRLLQNRVQVRGAVDTEIAGSNQNEAYPTRVILGTDYRVTEAVTLSGEQEFAFANQQDTQSTRVGLALTPWTGFNANSSVSRHFTENGERMFANYGLRQVLSRGDNWTFDVGMDRSHTISQAGITVPDQVNRNAVPVRGNPDGDFTALFAGANYRLDDSEWVSRLEYRVAEAQDRWNLTGGYKKDLVNGVVLAGILDLRRSDGLLEESSDDRLNLGFAWRPVGSRWIVIDKLELGFADQSGGDFTTRTRKAINNLNVNYQWGEDTQLALQYGLKYVTDTIDGQRFSGITDLIGTEVRRNVSADWDIGLSASALRSWNSGATDYSYGVSLGRTFATNSWASVGYNFDGFRDADFDDDDYTTKGVYLKFRFKFDQDSARTLFKEKNVFEDPAR